MIDLGNESPKINIDTPAQIRSIQSVNYLEQICGHSHLLHESGTWVQMPNGRKRKGKRTRMHFRLFSSLKRQAGEVRLLRAAAESHRAGMAHGALNWMRPQPGSHGSGRGIRDGEPRARRGRILAVAGSGFRRSCHIRLSSERKCETNKQRTVGRR